MSNQETAPEPIIVQFGAGQKIHYMTFRIATPFGSNKSFVAPMSCGVENRWNVHGTFDCPDLTIADVDCKKCMADLRKMGLIE